MGEIQSRNNFDISLLYGSYFSFGLPLPRIRSPVTPRGFKSNLQRRTWNVRRNSNDATFFFGWIDEYGIETKFVSITLLEGGGRTYLTDVVSIGPVMGSGQLLLFPLNFKGRLQCKRHRE